MTQKIFWLSLSATVMALAMQSRAEALTFTTYTNRSDFEAAIKVGKLSTQNFNSYTQDTGFRNKSLTVGDLTLTDTSGNSLHSKIDASPFAPAELNINNTSYASLYAKLNSGPSIGFNSAITAFGADFGEIANTAQGTRFEFDDGSSLLIPNRGTGNSAGNGDKLIDG
ncbi:MAG: hypothetical protein WBA76_13070 [Phormidesmis sp.]